MTRFRFVLAFLCAGPGAMAQNLYSNRAQIDSAYASEHYPPGTEAGISAHEMQEYVALTGLPAHRQPETRARATELFGRMSRAQQLQQRYVFVRAEAPPPERKLSEAEWTDFTDATRFTPVVDGKPVAGSLKRFRPDDFASWEASDYEMKPSDDAPFTRKVALYTKEHYRRLQEYYAASAGRYDQLVVRGRVPR